MILKKNQHALKKNYSCIYDKLFSKDVYDETDVLHKENSEDDVIIEESKCGQKIVACIRDGKTIYLNSKYNSINEAKKYMSDFFDAADKSFVSMYGIANGDFARVLIENVNKNVSYLIYEPSVNIFKEILQYIDISDIILNEKVTLVIKGLNDEALEHFLSDKLSTCNKLTNKHAILPKYAALYGEELKEYHSVIKSAYETLNVISETTIEYAERACKNNILNLCYLNGCQSGEDYINVFPKDMPAILVSAGPSLEKNVDLLKRAKGKALILAVDTAVKTVVSHGIVPDMIMSVDFIKPINLFQQEGLEKIPFLASPDLNYEVFQYLKPERAVFCYTMSNLWRDLFLAQGSDIMNYECGSSVATAAIATLVRWGFKRVILVGQDLALSGNKVHAGDKNETKIDMNSWLYMYTEGINEPQIITRKDFMMFIQWIEQMAYNNQDVDFIDATEGGARKKHTRIMTLSDAIDNYCKTIYDIDGVINSVPRLFVGESKEIVSNAFSKMKDELNTIVSLMQDGIKACERGKYLLENHTYDLKELKQINAVIEKADTFYVDAKSYSFLIGLVAEEDDELHLNFYVEEKNHIAESIRMYEMSKKYYQSIIDAVPKLIEFLNNGLSLIQ